MLKTTTRLRSDFDDPDKNYDPDETLIVDSLFNFLLAETGGDDYAWMSSAKQYALSLKDHYNTDGSRKANDGIQFFVVVY